VPGEDDAKVIDVLVKVPKTASPKLKLVGSAGAKLSEPKICVGIPAKIPKDSDVLKRSPISKIVAVLTFPVFAVGEPMSANPWVPTGKGLARPGEELATTRITVKATAKTRLSIIHLHAFKASQERESPTKGQIARVEQRKLREQ